MTGETIYGTRHGCNPLDYTLWRCDARQGSRPQILKMHCAQGPKTGHTGMQLCALG
jgi:hypothetical protein